MFNISGCCLLVLSVLIFYVNTCCDFLPVEGSVKCTSQTPAKFDVCYRIVELSTSIKFNRIHVLIYFLVCSCCNGSSFDPNLINVTKQFQSWEKEIQFCKREGEA